MIKKIFLSALLAISVPSMAQSLVTKDNLISVTVSGNLAYLRTPVDDNIIRCTLGKILENPQWESGVPGKAVFYQCGNGVVMSFKGYQARNKDDMLFVFQGNKLMYAGELSGKLQ